MRHLLAAAFAATLASAAFSAEDALIRQKAAQGVMETAEAMAAAMQQAGLVIFTRVDHAAGAAGIGEQIGASQLLIFGSPNVGTPAIQDDPLAGLFLPMKVLIFEDAQGDVTIAYEDPAAMLSRLDGIDGDEAYIEAMRGALAQFTAAQARN